MPAARFSVLCDECIRIEWSPGDPGRFVDEPSLFAAARPLPRKVILADAGAGAPPIVVRTSRGTVRFQPDGRAFHRGNLGAQIALPAERGSRSTFWLPGDRNEQNLGGTIETLDGIRGPVAIGEGLLARDGWQVVDDSRGHLLVDGWATAREWRGVPETGIDWYLFLYGQDFRAALRALARVAGPVPTPRRAALGSWYSRYWPHTSAEFRGIVADYHRHGIPLDTMVLDMDWHSASSRDRWTGWSWNRELLPDAEDLLDWLHNHGVQVALNLHPADGVAADEERYAAFMRAQGADPHSGERLAFDAGNRAYMTALFDQILAPLEEQGRGDAESVRARSAIPTPEGLPTGPFGGFDAARGVDFWWLDWQQDRFVPSVPGLTNLGWLNHLFYRHTARGGRRGMSLSRWAGLHAGDHRHPMHFSGDAHTGWAMLAFQVPFTVAASNAGCFYWSHDIGGHFGPRIEECTARWCWFGALSAAMRLHSARTAALDRRPWTYAEPFRGAMKAAFGFRAALMPTIDRAAHECEEKALPLLRPMYLDHAGDERAYRAHGQYTIGGDLLAAPVTTPGCGPRFVAAARVWFPPTSAWFNWFTHARYEPGVEAAMAAPIDEAPCFAPAGVPILTRGFSHRPAAEPIDHLIFRLYPGTPGSTHARELHEDDGDSTEYRRGGYRRTPVSAAWSGKGRLRLTVGPARGGFEGAPAARDITIALGAADSVSDVRIDGEPAEAVRGEGGLLLVCAKDIRADRELCVEADVAAWSPEKQGSHDRDLRAALAACVGEIDPGAVDGEPGGAPDTQSTMLAAAFGIMAWADTAAPAGVGRADSVRICDPFRSIDSGRVEVELVERIGRGVVKERQIAATELDLSSAAQEAAEFRLPDGALAEPPMGLRAVRVARLRFSVGGKPFVQEVLVESAVRSVTGFRAAGPFPWDWRTAIDEQVFDPERVSLRRERLAAWTAAQPGDKWPVDFRRTFPGGKGLAYAATVIRSEREQTTTLHLDCGDKIEAWLDGTKVFSQNGHDTVQATVSSVRLRLARGDSVLLIKTNEGGGGWGFAATLDGEEPVSITGPDGVSGASA